MTSIETSDKYYGIEGIKKIFEQQKIPISKNRSLSQTSPIRFNNPLKSPIISPIRSLSGSPKCREISIQYTSRETSPPRYSDPHFLSKNNRKSMPPKIP